MQTAITTQDYRLPPEQVPETLVETLSRDRRDECIHQIKRLMRGTECRTGRPLLHRSGFAVTG